MGGPGQDPLAEMTSSRPFLALVLAAFLVGSAHGGVGIAACVGCASTYCPWIITVCLAGSAVATIGAPAAAAACILVACGAPCAAVCTTVATCFHNDTMISIPSGEIHIAELKAGDSVGTNGDDKVVENTYVPGEVSMVTMHMQTPMASLTVTENHWMLVGGAAVPAIEIAAGTVLSRQLGNADPAVSAVTRSMSPGRWALSTRSCKVYANGILTGTLCGNQSSELWTQPLRRWQERAVTVLA